MFLDKIEVLREFNMISVVIRLFLALIIGAALGIEREQKQRPAGFRTYILVCVGSALATITGIYLNDLYGTVVDPSRIPAQIVSGIGFLGAGTIIVTRVYRVKGLTTAAGLWCCAAVGIAAGAGFYTGAILSGIMIMVSLRVFAVVDRRLSKYNKYIHCYVEYKAKDFVRELICYVKKNNFRLHDLEISKDTSDGVFFATFELRVDNPHDRTEIVTTLQSLPGCVMLEEIV